MSERVYTHFRLLGKCNFVRFGISRALKEKRGNCEWMLSQTHKCGLLILILLGLFLKPLLAVTSQHVSHTLACRKSCLKMCAFFFFFVTEGKRKECLSQAKDKHKHISRANRNSPGSVQSVVDPAHVKTQSACHSRWCCQALCLTAPENYPAITEALWDTWSICCSVKYVWGRFELYLVFTAFSHFFLCPIPNEFERRLVFWHDIDATWFDNQTLHRGYTQTCRPIWFKGSAGNL